MANNNQQKQNSGPSANRDQKRSQPMEQAGQADPTKKANQSQSQSQSRSQSDKRSGTGNR